jgi:starch synthase
LSYSDAAIRGSETLPAGVEKLLENLNKPVLDYKNEDEFLPAYVDFYNTLMEETVER